MNKKKIIWTLIIPLMAILILWHAWSSEFDHDEIEHLHAAWLVSTGETPFVDFLEQHHPVLWYLFAPVVGQMSSPHTIVFLARMFDLAILALFIYLFCKICLLIFPGVDSGWPALLSVSSFTFTRNMIEFRPDPLMNLMVFAGLFFLLLYLKAGGRLRAVFSGLFFGSSIVILQKALVFIGVIYIATIIAAITHLSDKAMLRRAASGILISVAVMFVPLLVMCYFILRAGFFGEFVFWNYMFNRFFYLETELPAHFKIWVTAGRSISQNFVIWELGIIGILMIARSLLKNWQSDANAWAKFIIFFVAIAYFISLVRSKFPFDHYFIVWMPLMALASCEVYAYLKLHGKEIVFKIAALLMAIEMAILMFLYPTSDAEQKIQRYVLDNTKADETVIISPPKHPITRRDGSYFWYNSEMIGKAYANYCKANICLNNAIEKDTKTWKKDKPSFVFIEPKYPNTRPYRFEEHAKDYTETGIEGLLKHD